MSITITITYHAPEGDSPVVDMRGVRFFDGQAKALDVEEHAGLIAKLRGNQHFEVEGDEDKAGNAPLTGLAKARAAKAAKKQQNL
jgi:hypothetical protein